MLGTCRAQAQSGRNLFFSASLFQKPPGVPCPQLPWVKILTFKFWPPKMGDRSQGLSETYACCLLRYHRSI